VGIEDFKRSQVVSEVTSALHSYETDMGVRFVDRMAEVEWLLDKLITKWAGYLTVLYGPKGCGKTTLFEALDWASHRLNLYEMGYSLTVIEYDPESGYVILRGPKRLLERVKGILGRFFESIEFKAGLATPHLEISVGGSPHPNPHVRVLVDVLHGLVERLEEDVNYVVVVDEYRIVNVEHLIESLNVLANRVRDLNVVARERGSTISIVMTTSDAIVAEARHRVGSRITWALTWNLPRQSADELARNLNLYESVSNELGLDGGSVKELLWKLSGGNPRALKQIKEFGLKEWLAKDIIDPMEKLSLRLGEETFLDYSRKVVENVDSILGPHRELYLGFLRKNIVVDVSAAFPRPRNSKTLLINLSSVVWVGPWLGLICFTQASWGPVEPNAMGLPSETLPKRPGSSHRNPCRGIPSEIASSRRGYLSLTPRPK